jgi:hypothetical protein
MKVLWPGKHTTHADPLIHEPSRVELYVTGGRVLVEELGVGEYQLKADENVNDYLSATFVRYEDSTPRLAYAKLDVIEPVEVALIVTTLVDPYAALDRAHTALNIAYTLAAEAIRDGASPRIQRRCLEDHRVAAQRYEAALANLWA